MTFQRWNPWSDKFCDHDLHSFLTTKQYWCMGTRQFFSFATKTTLLRNRASVSRFFFKSRSLNGVATTNKFIMQKTKNLWPEHIVVAAVLLRNAIKSLTLWHLAYTVPKDMTWNVAGKTWYYAEYFMKYHVFLFISCYIAEIWIAFLTGYLSHGVFNLNFIR